MSCYSFLTVFKGIICLQKEFAGYILHSIYKFQVSGFLFRMKLGVGQKLESGCAIKVVICLTCGKPKKLS